MDKWAKARHKFRMYGQNLDKWLSLPMMGTWEKLIEDDGETSSVTSEEESISRSLIDLNDCLWEEQPTLPFSESGSISASNSHVEAAFGYSQQVDASCGRLLDLDDDQHPPQFSQKRETNLDQVGQGENVRALREQLEEARRSHRLDCIRYQTELNRLQQQAEELKDRLRREVQHKMRLLKEYEELKEHLRRGQGGPKTEQPLESETVVALKEQLQEAQHSHHWELIKYQTELQNAQQQAEHLRNQLQQGAEQRTAHPEQEEHRHSATWSQETLRAELQAEREMKQLLQEQVAEARLHHQQERAAYASELERLQKQSVATQRELQQQLRQKEALQREHEELKQSFRRSRESLTSMVQLESKMKQLLKEQLREAKGSHQRESVKYKTELLNVQQHADTLRGQLHKEVQQRMLLDKELGELKQSFKCIQETLKAELKVEKEMNQLLQKELRDARRSNLQDDRQGAHFHMRRDNEVQVKSEDGLRHDGKQNLFQKLVHTIRPVLRHPPGQLVQLGQLPHQGQQETLENLDSWLKQSDGQQHLAVLQPEPQDSTGKKVAYKKKHRSLRDTSKQEKLLPVYPYHPFHDELFLRNEQKVSNIATFAEELHSDDWNDMAQPLNCEKREAGEQQTDKTLNQMVLVEEVDIATGGELEEVQVSEDEGTEDLFNLLIHKERNPDGEEEEDVDRSTNT